jgi:4-amino-4-deoxy-L-arabinose transferase-like glycosyltransferase
MAASIKRLAGLADLRSVGAPLAIAAGAVLLRVISGVGFVNYDTLYALAWGGQLSRGETPAYGVAIAPTPHPLVEALGLVLSPLGPRAVANVTVALGFLALSACGWVIYRLGAEWFGRAAGALAALIFLTRVPVLSYGVRAYVDLPYLLLVLGALLVESRRRRAGAPVLALLALAGLLRPEAWAFSGLYWLYLMDWMPSFLRARIGGDAARPGMAARPRRTRREIACLTLLAAAAPLVWVLSDLAITGRPLWSLTNTRQTAATLGRKTGIANVPEYIPRRIGEILRPPVLVGAALGGVLSLLWLRRRALLGAAVGVLAVVVFAAFATLGLPINTRYAFLAAAILSVFCGAGVVGWTCLQRGDPRRRWWMVGGALVLVALLAYSPSQYRSAHRELDKLARQQSIEGDLLALVDDHSINLRCGPIGVPNHAPIPLLALYLDTSPKNIVSLQVGHIASGVYVDPASREVEQDYVLDLLDPHEAVSVPPGFTEVNTNRSWLIFQRCT